MLHKRIRVFQLNLAYNDIIGAAGVQRDTLFTEKWNTEGRRSWEYNLFWEISGVCGGIQSRHWSEKLESQFDFPDFLGVFSKSLHNF